VVAAVGLAMLLTACGGAQAGTGARPAPVGSQGAGAGGADGGAADLVIWTDNLKVGAVRSVAQTFAKANGISVKVQVVSSDLQTNFVTADAAGNGPDVVVGAHDWIGNLVQNGAVDPLPISPEQLSAYSELAVRAVTYGGQLYGIPYGVEAVALYRNTAVAPDPVSSLDEAFEIGTAAVRAGKVDSAFNLPVGQNGDAYHMQPVLTSFGGYLFGTDPQGDYDPADLGLAKPAAIEAAKRIASLGEKGAGVLRRSISGDNSIALFTAGKAAFLESGPWALNDVKKSGVKYAVQPLPGFEGQEPAQPFMGAQAFMVAANGENKAFAQEFVASGVNNEKAMRTMFDLARLPPAMKTVAKQVGAEDPDIAVFTAAAERAAPMPAIPAMASVWEPLGKAYSAIVGGADPQRTMTTTNRTIQAAISG
jgi:arabinogalactan oligomer/maltooligosaccharide transport system substrate-binding protein